MSRINKVNKKQQEQEHNSQLLSQEELSLITPWNLWRTRLDRLSYFNPIDMFQYYFVRHSTGPSYAYLFFCVISVALFSALVADRYIKDSMFEDNHYYFPQDSDRNTKFNIYYVPDETGFLLYNYSSPITDSSIYSFQVCRQTPPILYPFTYTAQCSAPVSGRMCSVMSSESIHQCVPSSVNQMLLSPYSDAVTNWIYIRFSLNIPTNSNSDLKLVFRGHALTNTFTKTSSWGQLLRSYTWELMKGRATHSELVYEPIYVRTLGRFMVDASQNWFTSFHEKRDQIIQTNNDNVASFTAIMTLTPRVRYIIQSPFTLVDVISTLSSYVLLIWVAGHAFRAFNQWHFLNYGQFISAQLPEYYIDCLFDPVVPFTASGLKELTALKEDKKNRVTRKDIRLLHEDVMKVRRQLDAVVKK